MDYDNRNPRPVSGLTGINTIEVDRVHGGFVREGVLDFSASVNPLGPPPTAIDAYHSAVDAISSYPQVYPDKLAAGLADWLGIPARQIIVGNGSTQLIHLFARRFRTMFPYVAIPTFSEFANAIALNDCTPYALELSRNNGFTITLADVRNALAHRAQAIFIGRPNSPTGSMISLAEAEQIAAECERFHAFCMFDEAFIDFVDRAESAIRLMQTIPARPRKGLLVLGSLTKIFAIPGLRIGFLAGPEEIIEAMREHIEPWSLNVIAERVSLACLEQADDFARLTHQWLVPERTYLRKCLSSIPGLLVLPSAANFLMLQADETESDTSFGEFMLRQRIAVRDLRTLPGCGDGFYRIAVRNRDDNDRLIAAAAAYFERQPQ